MTSIKLARNIFLSAIVVILFVVISIWWLDRPLAIWITEYVKTYIPAATNNITDYLLIIVVILSSLSWAVYFYLLHRNIHNQSTTFSRITGTVLPLSFALKVILKWLFGRTETHLWLINPSLYGFQWFSSIKGFEGFPSGHMLVFTPLFLALWQFYPRYYLCYAAAWLGLALALLITEYHFLSDVVAGAYLGILLYLAVVARLDNQLTNASKKI